MREIKTPPELYSARRIRQTRLEREGDWHEYTGWFEPARRTTELMVCHRERSAGDRRTGRRRRSWAERGARFCLDGSPSRLCTCWNRAGGGSDSMLGREVKREALQLLLQQTGGKNLWERLARR